MKKFVFRVRQIDDGCDIIRYDRIQKAEFSVSAARLVLKFSSHDIRNDDVIWDSCEDGGALPAREHELGYLTVSWVSDTWSL